MAALKPFVEDLEKELTCSICQDIFTEPKSLPCLHSYCVKCIDKWYQKGGNQETNQFDCPVCKVRTDVPDGDVSKLQSSFYLHALLKLLQAMRSKSTQDKQMGESECQCCEKSLALVAFCPQCNGMICDDCVSAHKSFKHLREEHYPILCTEFKQENVNSFVKNQMFCKEKFHEKNKLEYYCQEEACKRCICQKCATLYHQKHRKQSLEEAAEEVKQVVQRDMSRARRLKERYEEELQQSKKNMDRIQEEIDLAKQKVQAEENCLYYIVKEHSREMINSLHQILRDQKKANDEEQRDIFAGIHQLSEFEANCQKLLERSVAYDEMTESKELLQQKCEKLLESPSILSSKPIQRDMTVHYVTNQEVMESLQDVGKIIKSVIDPSRSTIELLHEARCGFLNEFQIVTRNPEGLECYSKQKSTDVKIKDDEDNEVEKKVFDQQNGKYRVRYKAEKAAPYEIQVNVGGEPIQNSPQIAVTIVFEAEFKPLLRKKDDKGQLSEPESIALGQNGEIAIADTGNNRIQIFRNGEYLREFGVEGTEEGELLNPIAVVFNDNKIIVSDIPDNRFGRVQEFDSNGNYLKTLLTTEDSRYVAMVTDICIAYQGNIAMCCNGNKVLGIKYLTRPSIKVYSKEGNFIKEFDITDNNTNPTSIAYGNGKFFVSFQERNYIHVFDENGISLSKFGKKGTRGGQFDGVGGLAVYDPDRILVCDINNHRVQLLTQEGQFISSFGSYGTGVDEMLCPCDLVVTDDGRVLVLELHGNRVQVWR